MKIDVKGTIIHNNDKWVYDWFEMQSTCPKDVLTAIQNANGERLDVYINSEGGDIGAGSEIYAALQEYKGEVFIHIVGYACSAASVIACAGHCDMVRTGLFMYHNVSGTARGDYHRMNKSAEILMTANRAVAAAYSHKTGKSEQELLAAMDAETWITAEEAVEIGFVDEIAENQNLKLTASVGNGLIPSEVIDKMRNTLKSSSAAKLQAELDFLKLKGANLL